MLLSIPRIGQLDYAAHGAFRDDCEHRDDQTLANREPGADGTAAQPQGRGPAGASLLPEPGSPQPHGR
jgi:hypothetical protein